MSSGKVSNGGSYMESRNKDNMDVILEVEEDDSKVVHTVKAAVGDDVDDHEKRSFPGIRNASANILQVAQELQRMTLFSRKLKEKSAATNALKGLKFIGKTDGASGWMELEKRFDDITRKTDGLLPRTRFGECLGMNKDSNEFAEELLDALIRRRKMTSIDLISKAQMKEFWGLLADQSFNSRLQTFFAMVDKDANGQISEEEVREMISSSASANRLSNIQKQAGEYATLIMEELDPEKRGYIMIDSLKKLFLQTPAQSVGGERKNLSEMLSQTQSNVNDTNIVQQKYHGLKYFLQDHWERIWVIALWIAVMAVLFTWKYIQYKNRAAFEVMGHCVCVAKGAAETLKFNMALILFPVCRNTIRWLRNKTKLDVMVPFDDNLNFHKVIAFGIIIGVGLHVISHLACDFPRVLSATADEYEPMVQYFGKQPNSYWWFVKGVEGWTGIVMVVLMTIAFILATPWFRRGRFINLLSKKKSKIPKALKKFTGFNAFWYSHHLFIIVYAMLIVHGIKLYLTKEWYKKTTWMYLAVPVLLYAAERLTRVIRSSVNPAEILKAVKHPGDVLALYMSKPKGFKYQSGQYMFVNCSAVSPFEWHPFSITSAPGDNYLGVHIRALGDWTKELHNVFSKVSQLPADGKQVENPNYPKVRIDGPYSAPSQDYKSYEVVLLVGLGIGGTPVISIIRDIINNMKAKKEEDDSLEAGGNNTLSQASPASQASPSPLMKKKTSNKFKTTRAYSYWVTREQGTFDWFRGVMNEVAEINHDGVIEMHNYCTSVFEEDDARSAFISTLQSLKYAKTGVDVVSGTRVKSHFAKPDWRSVYNRIALLHPGQRIGIFYCGTPILVEELKQLAYEFSHNTSTKFDFHKENF